MPARALMVLDSGLAAAQPGLTASIAGYFAANGQLVRLVGEPVRLPGGETAKNSWTNFLKLLEDIQDRHLDRHSYVVAAGGGALLDVAGLAAATAHRGVRLVRVPSTTLSQCDSGVGVKNGINAFGKKNFIGTFCPPWAVINDFQLLASLPEAERRAGCAEAVKVACIRSAEFFGWIEAEAAALGRFEPSAMRKLIRRCAELHVEHIARGGDPFETGSARPLDFGHWSAHKLEQLTGFQMAHGEAVAIGVALDVIYSRRKGQLAADLAERVLSLLEALGFELFAPELLQENEAERLVLIEGLEEFREHLGGALAIPLLRAIGSSFEAHEMSAGLIHESIQELQARHASRPGAGKPVRA